MRPSPRQLTSQAPPALGAQILHAFDNGAAFRLHVLCVRARCFRIADVALRCGHLLEVTSMKGRLGRIVQVGSAAVVAVLLAASAVAAAETINFSNTTVGQTRTAQFTYTLTPESGTSAAVTITPPASPFGIDGALTFSLSPGQSRTFNVTFSPTQALPYEGQFTITAIGGFPPTVITETVNLTGTGTSGTSGTIWDLFPGVTITPGEPDEEVPELAQVEAKLDGIGTVLDEFRSKLDSLGWWLGRLTHGIPLAIEPYSTNAMPQTNTWEQLAKLEAKLDQLLLRPDEVSLIDIYVIIMQINTLVLDINQWVINLGGNTAALETKLDGLEVKIDDLEVWLDDQFEWLDQMFTWLYDTLSAEIAANADAIAALEVKSDEQKAALDALRNDIGTIKTDVAAIKTDVGTIKTDVATVKTDVATIKTDVATVKTDVATIKTDVTTVKTGVAANNAAITANGNAITANGNAITANANAIAANNAAINNLAARVQGLLASNYRIEDMLKQQQGYPAAPNGSKITLTMGGGPLPGVSLEASVVGAAGAVEPNAVVTIYWPMGLPPSTVTADAGGAFSLTIGTGSLIYFAVDVSQTDSQGRESARVNVPASP
jgi:hypothetical protein